MNKKLFLIFLFLLINPISSHLFISSASSFEGYKQTVIAGGILAAACATYYMLPDSELKACKKAYSLAERYRKKTDAEIKKESVAKKKFLGKNIL